MPHYHIEYLGVCGIYAKTEAKARAMWAARHDGEIIAITTAHPDAIDRQYLAYIGDHPGTLAANVVKVVAGCSKSAGRHRLGVLESLGYIEQDRSIKLRVFCHITENGREALAEEA